MTKFKSYWVGCLIVVVLAGLGVGTRSYAQDAQCGNGMMWRLKKGDIGRVPLDEPTPSTLRENPGGQGIGFIQVGETFAVIDDPQCTPSTGTSWWYVRKADWSLGWVSEGNKGDYWIEPFTPELFLDVRTNQCKSTLPPRLTVGNLARLLRTDATLLQEIYQGAVQLYTPIEQWLTPLSSSLPLRAGNNVLTVGGPSCLNGSYIWKFRSIDQTDNQTFWFYESLGNEYMIEPSMEALPAITENIPTTTSLSLEQSAPIIDIQHQVAVAMGGGDPGCEDPGSIQYYVYPYDNLTGGCIEITFLPNTSIDVRFYRPNGTIYGEEKVVTSSSEFSRYPNAGNVGFGRFAIPRHLNLPAGIWKIDYLYNDVVIGSTAYELMVYPKPVLEMGCDGLQQVVKFTGFQPLEEIDLVLTKSYWDQKIGEEGFYAFFTSHEVSRWQLKIGLNGELAAHVEFPFREMNEHEYQYFQVANTFLQANAFPPACSTPWLKKTASDNVMSYGGIATGYVDREFSTYQFTFAGKKGDKVDINLVSFNSLQFDPLLRLEASDGNLLTENDNATNPQYGALDSEIANFELPLDDTYTIVVTTAKEGAYESFTLMLQEHEK